MYTCIWRIPVFGVAPDLATWAPEWSIHPKNPAQGRLRPAQGTAQGTFSSLTILLLYVSISYFVVPGF